MCSTSLQLTVLPINSNVAGHSFEAIVPSDRRFFGVI